MPELPEVETIARELNAELPGRRIASVRVFRNDALGKTPPERFRRALKGLRVREVTRRGKYLLFHLENHGNVPRLLVAHLRMTGKFVISPPLKAPEPHHRAWFTLDDGRLLVFQDMRCFGTLKLAGKPEDDPGVARLGPEPLGSDFTPRHLAEGLSKSAAPLKHYLMDQAKVAGLGNIYVSEILHRARLSPRRAANTLSAPQSARLHKAIRAVLRDAILKNGTTVSDFRRVDDKTGTFQNFLRVYGKAGEPCPTCRTPIARIVQQQRSSFFCPTCQT